MLETSPCPPPHFRTLLRFPIRPPINLTIRAVRPSLLDLRLTGDCCVFDLGGGMIGVCVGEYGLARICGMPLDVPSLNLLLDRTRSRPPRRRSGRRVH
jgi:hypothetical protein